MTAPRRYPRWQDALGATLAGIWPVALTLAVLRNPARYDPFALFSGLGRHSYATLAAKPTVDPGVYTTQYTLGIRAATLLVHGHVPWWNPFEALGAPLIGELESGGLFPLTPLLLVHDGSLVYHLVLLAIAGVATYFLLRELRCGPLVATVGGMLFATNGTFAWLANAASSPVCFLPIMMLGVERARRAAADGRGGGWRWLAVGAALALLAGFIEVAALGLILVALVAIQRAWTIGREHLAAYARKVLAGLACGMGIAAPMLVAFDSFLLNGYVAQHAGNTADHGLVPAYVSMIEAPYLFGRIGANAYPQIHQIWGAVGGYAGFALIALAVASLFFKRDRGLRVVLAVWVGVALADSVAAPGIKNLIALAPVTQHIVLYRYLPPTWELALVILAALAMRDLSTAPRATAVVAMATGVLVAALTLLYGMSLAHPSISASRTLAASSMRQSELIVIAVIAALLLAAIVPGRHRALAVGAVAVTEAAILFAIPLASWPTSNRVDVAVTHYLQHHVGSTRFFSLGVPTPNLGSEIGVRQLDVVDLPVPKPLVGIERSLDRYEHATAFTGDRRKVPRVPTVAELLVRHLRRFEALGVRYVVAPTTAYVKLPSGAARLVYHDDQFRIWRLDRAAPLVHAPGCGLRTVTQDTYVTSCHHETLLVRSVLSFPGWSASVNGRPVPILTRNRFQAVVVPRGHAVVALTYLPPYVPAATAMCVLALLALMLPYEEIAQWRRERRRRPTWAELDDADPGQGRPPIPVGTLPAWLGGPVPAEPPVPVGAAPSSLEPEGPSTSSLPAITGSVPVVTGEEPSTSSVPAVTGSVQAVSADDGPPTSAVAVETVARAPDDPPTNAVPKAGPEDAPT